MLYNLKMEKKIVRPGGQEYMTVALVNGQIEFRNFSSERITVRFDAKVLDQLVPFLKEAQFWNKIKENERKN
jgi:hypothetical protein